jgi:arsenate reductase-like glutaredoxin family protein
MNVFLDHILSLETSTLKNCPNKFKQFSSEMNYLLLKTPIVRNGRLATVGYSPEVWKEWILVK